MLDALGREFWDMQRMDTMQRRKKEHLFFRAYGGDHSCVLGGDVFDGGDGGVDDQPIADDAGGTLASDNATTGGIVEDVVEDDLAPHIDI
jgi:hypothetical protein